MLMLSYPGAAFAFRYLNDLQWQYYAEVVHRDCLPPNEFNDIFFVHDGATPHDTAIVDLGYRWLGSNRLFR